MLFRVLLCPGERTFDCALQFLLEFDRVSDTSGLASVAPLLKHFEQTLDFRIGIRLRCGRRRMIEACFGSAPLAHP
jgi:hypothetical protein